VEVGTTNGVVTEIVSGIGKGTEVLTEFSISNGEEQEEKQSNPFMPKPRNNKNNGNSNSNNKK
jgi:HlyD family secretion protein